MEKKQETCFIKFVQQNVKTPAIRRTIIKFARVTCCDMSEEDCKKLMIQIGSFFE